MQGLSQVYLEVAVRAGYLFAAVHLFFRKPPVRRTMGGWTAATEVQQEIFSHLALMSVELANSFWPRKLSAAPIGFSFQCKTLFEQVEHLILWLEVVDEEEAVGLVDPVQLVLRQQGAQLFDDGVQLVLVAQPPAAEKLLIDPRCRADEPQLLRAHPGADLQVPTGRREVCGAVGYLQSCRRLSAPDTASSSPSVILRCLWMMSRSAASSHSS